MKLDEKSVVIVNKRTSKPVSVSVLKAAYVLYGRTITEISEFYGVAEVELEGVIERFNWDEARENLRGKVSQDVGGNTGDVFLDSEELIKKALEAWNQIARAELSRFQAHVAYYGDPYSRHPETGDILIDYAGNPIPIKISAIPKKPEFKPLDDAKKHGKAEEGKRRDAKAKARAAEEPLTFKKLNAEMKGAKTMPTSEDEDDLE